MREPGTLGASLEGCTHVNLKKLAREHFTPAFLRERADSLLSAATMVGRLGLPVSHEIDELDKCVVHHASRELIADLWKFSMPVLEGYVGKDKRFNLDAAVTHPAFEGISSDLSENFDTGQRFFADVMLDLHDAWVADLARRHKENPDNEMATLFTIYRSHAILINGGDWDAPNILELTYTSAGRERFDWLREYPDMSRAELEAIVENSRAGPMAQADGLGITSAAKEEVVRFASEEGLLSYVFDPREKKIIFNPELNARVAVEEEMRRDHYYDPTQLLLQCPAKFAPSSLYPGGGMLHDISRFRESLFVELYLATHDRR